MTDIIAHARETMPAGEAAALVRNLTESQVAEQERHWQRINSVVAALKRREEVNRIGPGLRMAFELTRN